MPNGEIRDLSLNTLQAPENEYAMNTIRTNVLYTGMIAGLLLPLPACGGDDGSSVQDDGGTGSSNDGGGGVISTPSAFNVYDENTYSESTCENAPIVVPEGLFVRVDGTSTGAGTVEDPLDLATALGEDSPAQPGDTIWIAGGVYMGSYLAVVSGSEGAPITIRPLPGQRVIIDSNVDGEQTTALRIDSRWTDFHDLQTISSNSNRGSIEEEMPDVNGGSGVAIFGANTNLYNFIVNDNIGGGIDFWKTAVDGTLHGNIVYNNGYSASGRGHGHAVYTQNTNGYKNITKNIFFFGFQTGLHPYSTGMAPLNNFTIHKNVWFLTGASDLRRSQQKTNCIISSPAGVRNLVMSENLGYSQVDRGTWLSTGDGVDVGGSLTNNYLVEKMQIFGNWGEIPFVGNTIYGNIQDPDSQLSDVSGNVFEESRPSTGKKIFVEANGIDVRRGRVVIYNYDDDDAVDVDLSSILKQGEAYRIHSVFGLFDEPLLTGVFDGSAVSIPMGTVLPPQPNGEPKGIAEEDGPRKKFGTFIVTHGGCQ